MNKTIFLFILNFLEIYSINVVNDSGIIHSLNYPKYLRTNGEYTWIIDMNNSNEIEINLVDINIDNDHDYLQITTGKSI